MGTPISNLKQANNTFSANDVFSKVLGAHSIKAGLNFSFEQVNVNPNPTFNGSFLFAGSETGVDFADFLIGVASNYNQADSQTYYPRHKYAGGFAQDSWRARSNLTLNFGLRWELMQYWYEKYNQIPTFILGAQSKVFPTAPTGIVYPGDSGVPRTIAPQRNRFSPRLGIAWSPGIADGLWGRLAGEPGKMSIRAGYGIYYSVIQGNTLAFDEPQPALWPELHQPRRATICYALYHRGERRIQRKSVSAHVSPAQRFSESSRPRHRFLRVRTDCRRHRAQSAEHVSLH